MFKLNFLSLKNVAIAIASAAVFSASVCATELVFVGDNDDDGTVTIQCITGNNGQKICCEGGPGGMSCEVEV